MTIELVKILEAANTYRIKSNFWFEYYMKTQNEYDKSAWLEYGAKCHAMLEAYEILTGKKIYESEIENELTLC